MENITFGYWQIKGLGEFSRLTLAALGVTYTEENPESFEAWGAKAKELMGEGLHFPNLPYVKDGDFYLTESIAIPIYLARKAGRMDMLGGTDLQLNTRVSEINGLLGDIRMEVMKALFSPEYKGVLAKAAEADSKLNRKLMFLSKFLGENEFLLGGTFGVIDIMVAYTLYLVSNILKSGEAADVVANFENLVAHQARVWGQDGIKEHIASDAWKRPLLFPTMFPWVTDQH